MSGFSQRDVWVLLGLDWGLKLGLGFGLGLEPRLEPRPKPESSLAWPSLVQRRLVVA